MYARLLKDFPLTHEFQYYDFHYLLYEMQMNAVDVHRDANVEMACAEGVAVTSMVALDCHLLNLLLEGLSSLV